MLSVYAEDVNDIFIYQEGKEQTVPVYNGVIELEKKPFSIRVYNKKYDWDAKQAYTTQIAVLLSKDRWEKVKSGGKVEKSSYFSGGSAFAITQENRYNALFFSDSDDDYIGGSHNIRYATKKDNQTADLLKKVGDYYKLAFKVDTLYLGSKMIKIENSEIQNLYFMIFSDKNLDGVMDEDELTKFIVRLN